jgi:hypothetical protein
MDENILYQDDNSVISEVNYDYNEFQNSDSLSNISQGDIETLDTM